MATKTKVENENINVDEEEITVSKSTLEQMIEEALKQKMKMQSVVTTGKVTAETEEARKLKAYYEEKVTVNLFLDNDKYKDDVMVNVNGKLWQIQRGVDVQVPRYVAEVLENSMKQDRATALRIRELESKYEAESKTV